MDHENITIGNHFPETFNAIIEIPKGTKNKYEYDEKLKLIKLDRVLHSPLYYPVDYGFIPQTRADDGDMGDVLVLTDSPVFSGCLLEVRAVGLLKMRDESGLDNKVLAVPVSNPNFKDIRTLENVGEHMLKEIVHFFEQYKVLEGKMVKVEGWADKNEALQMLKQEHDKYMSEK